MRVTVISGLGLVLFLVTSVGCSVYSNDNLDAGTNLKDGKSENTDQGSDQGSYQGDDQKYTDDQQFTNDWSFDLHALCEYLNCGSSPASVVVGRLQVMANPIFYQPNAMDDRYRWTVENEGSEPVYIQDIHTSGSNDFSIPSLPYQDRPFPWFLGSNDRHCGGGELFGISIVYSQISGENQEGELVIVTEDPTSPTLRVPILVDATGQYVDDGMNNYIFPEANMGVQPNPVRIYPLAPGESLVVEMCVKALGLEKRITHMAAYGDEFSILSATELSGNLIDLPIDDYILTDEMQIELVFEPATSKPGHGAVAFQFDDHRGIRQTLIVPIVVQ
ncbi:MAG: hypothetical protein JRJ87_16825 [Deltaproteobacteria bacterium]|nr:hypothetical protein [Deltaproteobacteria bacterium]